MPHLSCRTCGRRVYSVAPLSSMTPDERRCPRCGTPMEEDRRSPERRTAIRRENPPNDPGPPAALPATSDAKKKSKGSGPDRPERRVADRRTGRRRGGGSNLPPAPGSDSAGWQD